MWVGIQSLKPVVHKWTIGSALKCLSDRFEDDLSRHTSLGTDLFKVIADLGTNLTHL